MEECCGKDWCLDAALACLVYIKPSNLVDELLLVMHIGFHTHAIELLLMRCTHLLFALLSCLVCFTSECSGSLLQCGPEV